MSSADGAVMAIRTCFFDMGNVLVHFSHDRMCKNFAELCGLEETQVRQFLIAEQRQWMMERGELSEEGFLEQLQHLCGCSLALEDVRQAAADIFWLNEGIVPVLQRLRAAGQRLVLLSNTSVTHVRFIERHFSVLEYLDARVVSYEVGAMKPDERIFRAALAEAQCAPAECFYTDDIAAYTEAAAGFGIHVHTYQRTDLLVAELTRLGVLQRGGGAVS
jgi:putative hydrolase of the HAD superfamily